MPTYEYACESCGTHVEVYQRFSDEPLTTCNVCGGKLRKVFHPAGILFKGSGFYVTDSRGKSGGSKETKEAKQPATSGSKAEGSSSGSGSTDSSSSSSDSSSGSTVPSKKDSGAGSSSASGSGAGSKKKEKTA